MAAGCEQSCSTDTNQYEPIKYRLSEIYRQYNMAATSCTLPNYCAHTPPLNRLRSFLFQLKYHVCLTCFHPNRAPIHKLTPWICIALIQEPAIVEHRCGCPAASMVGSTVALMRGLSAFERGASYATLPAGVAMYRHQIEAAAPNIVLTAPRGALRSSTSQLKTILIVVLNHKSCVLIFAIWV